MSLRFSGRWGLAVSFSAGVCLVGTPARAAEKANAPGWAFGSPAGEAALIGASFASLATWFLPQRFNASWAPLEVRPYEPVWDSLSDLTGAAIGSTLQIANGYAFEGAYLSRTAQADPYERALRVPMIDGEAVVLTTGVILGLKRASGRCRPRAYKDGRCIQTRSAHEGFPSGHTGPIGAVAGAHLTLALRTEGDAGYRYAPFVVAEIGSIATAFLRVAAGAHDWSDVGVGWGLGHLIGVLVSVAHPMESVAPRAASGSALRVAPPAAPSFRWSGSF